MSVLDRAEVAMSPRGKLEPSWGPHDQPGSRPDGSIRLHITHTCLLVFLLAAWHPKEMVVILRTAGPMTRNPRDFAMLPIGNSVG